MANVRETKPEYSFSETSNDVTFVLIIDGLKVGRKITDGFAVKPKNGNVLNAIFTDQSFNFAMEVLSEPKKIYRFKIDRLPTQIDSNKVRIKYEKEKITIKLIKKVNDPWRNYAEYDYETAHLVRN